MNFREREELQRNRTFELRILGFENFAHAVRAEQLDDAVVRDGLADHHGAADYCARRRKVNSVSARLRRCSPRKEPSGASVNWRS